MKKSQDTANRTRVDPTLSVIEQETAKAKVDEEALTSNQRDLEGTRSMLVAALCVAYSVFHLLVMNVYPLETWAYRLSHVGGGLFLGFLLFGASALSENTRDENRNPASLALLGFAAAGIGYALVAVAAIWINGTLMGVALPPAWAMSTFGIPLAAGSALAILHGWLFPQRDRHAFSAGDILLAVAALVALVLGLLAWIIFRR